MEDFDFEVICEKEDPDERVTVVRVYDKDGLSYILYRDKLGKIKTLAKIYIDKPYMNSFSSSMSPLVFGIIKDIIDGSLS